MVVVVVSGLLRPTVVSLAVPPCANEASLGRALWPSTKIRTPGAARAAPHPPRTKTPRFSQLRFPGACRGGAERRAGEQHSIRAGSARHSRTSGAAPQLQF